MSLSPTIRATMLDDLRRQLLPVADDGDGDAEAWIGGDELYMAIRLCLLARDGRHDQRHGAEAERLFDALVAYARQDAYAPVQRGRLMYHAPSLIEAAGGASWCAASDHE